jgi:SPP1 family predicted phage head-tail adaptor
MTVAESITNALTRFGRPMVLRRLTWNGNEATATDVSVYGVNEGFLSIQLTDGQSVSGTTKVTFSNAQIAAAGWPGPPRKLDELIIDDGQVRTIIAVETKYLGLEVLVFEAQVQALSFDRLITIQRRTVTQDGYGQEVETWTELAEVEASKVDLSGDEVPAAAQFAATVATRFRIRWDSELADLSPLDRIVYEGRTYDIKVVKEQQFKVGFEILTVAEADAL